MSIGILYASPHLDASGYGEASRNAIMALRAGGANIKTQRVSFTGNVNYKTTAARVAQELETREIDYKIKIIHTTPDVYKNYMEKGKYHIGHLFWETDRLPASWVAPCNQMDELWTGTEKNAKSIRNSGVRVPIYIYPQTVVTDIPEVQPYGLPNFDGYLFYSIFDWNERKDPKTLIHAYWKEFKGEHKVGLLIKTHKSTYSEDGIKFITDQINMWKNSLGWRDTPRLFIHTDISDEEGKYRIHKTGDCYVTANRGEGWGLPVAEACMFKNPVISPKTGGICEYFNAREFYEVKCSMVPVGKVYNKYYEPDMNWAQVDEKDLMEKMRKVYNYGSQEKTKSLPRVRGGKACSKIKTVFSYDKVGRDMVKRLEDIEQGL